jgi:hypothetical protein
MKYVISGLIVFLITLKINAQATDSSLCENLTRTYDEFEKETTFFTPESSFNNGVPNCSLMKVVSKKGTFYYLSLYSPGYTFNVGERGCKIILNNGQLLTYPSEKVDVEYKDGRYTYSCFIALTSDKVQLLKKTGINKWKLYIYENELTQEQSELFRNYVNCILSKK